MRDRETPGEQRITAETWQGHGFGDDCEWQEAEAANMSFVAMFKSDVRIQRVANTAALTLEQFMSQDGRDAIRSFEEPDTKFSAWEYLSGTIVRVDLRRLHSPVGTTQMYRESGAFLGVTVRVNAESERDPELKIAVAKQKNFGARRGMVFDFMDPELIIGRVDHKKERRKNRKQDSYKTNQDMILVHKVCLLALGKREDPKGGKRSRVPSLLSVFQKQEKPA